MGLFSCLPCCGPSESLLAEQRAEAEFRAERNRLAAARKAKAASAETRMATEMEVAAEKPSGAPQAAAKPAPEPDTPRKPGALTPNNLAEHEEELFKYVYGADFPEALNVLGGGFLSRPKPFGSQGPKQILKTLLEAAEYRAPTRRKAGKGKTMPKSDGEAEVEFEQRKETQKQCYKLILPKQSGEPDEAFMRRLDTHRNEPHAIIPPMTAPEDEPLFIKRCVVTKDDACKAMLILPMGEYENLNSNDFEKRLAAAKLCPSLVFPRGAYESPNDFVARLERAKKGKFPIMPRSEHESDEGFTSRIDLQVATAYVVHPYDPARESESEYTRRLKANTTKKGLPFEPGDAKAVSDIVGAAAAEKKSKKEEDEDEAEEGDGDGEEDLGMY